MKKRLLLLLLVLGTIIQSCNKNDSATKKGSTIAKIEDILNGDDPNLKTLLNNVRGSVGRRSPGSKTIWSRKNEYSLGLYISANHVYSLSGWSSRKASFFDLGAVNPGFFETSQIPPRNGVVGLKDSLVADFPLMHFDISSSAADASILPEEDFHLGIVDNQPTVRGPFPQYPTNVQTNSALQMYDPSERTKKSVTWAYPIAAEQAVAVGYPQDIANYPNGAVAYGKILSDAEAILLMQKLKDTGDAEADIPYNSAAEFFIRAEAVAGMSGGGVFNSAGQLLGIMVRASDKEDAPKFIRVIKISFIKGKMIEFYSSLADNDTATIRPFIIGEL
jgi:hypothetical protein